MKPEPGIPGVRRTVYWLLCQLNRRPGFWRGLGVLFRRWPFLSKFVPVVAQRNAVTKALKRQDSFLNTSHVPNLVAGDFLIGMDLDARYTRDKRLFLEVMPTIDQVQKLSSRETEKRIVNLRTRGDRTFDVVEDYLMWIVHRSMESAFGSAKEPIAVDSPRGVPLNEGLERDYLHELRHVAAQLFAGGAAPADVQQRAEACAFRLHRRIDFAMTRIAGEWAPKCPVDRDSIQRDAVGFAWVSQPVTVQTGALIIRELLQRRGEHKQLWRHAQQLTLGCALTDPEFRGHVRNHVLELMRFRPVFPLLARDVPRDTAFEAGGGWYPNVKAGSKLSLLTIAALFDPKSVVANDAYWSQRPWGQNEDDRYLTFGYGERRCPGKDLAITMLVSALIGVLTLPRLRWADPWYRRMGYDGPIVSRMRLTFDN